MAQFVCEVLHMIKYNWKNLNFPLCSKKVFVRGEFEIDGTQFAINIQDTGQFLIHFSLGLPLLSI